MEDDWGWGGGEGTHDYCFNFHIIHHLLTISRKKIISSFSPNQYHMYQNDDTSNQTKG